MNKSLIKQAGQYLINELDGSNSEVKKQTNKLKTK